MDENKPKLNFTALMKQHIDDMKNSRYAAIQCLIANVILREGCSIWDVELVEVTKDSTVSWFVQKKAR